MSSTNQKSKGTFQAFTGKEYLLMDIASNYGLDKEDWGLRLHWAESHLSELQRISLMGDAELKTSIHDERGRQTSNVLRWYPSI